MRTARPRDAVRDPRARGAARRRPLAAAGAALALLLLAASAAAAAPTPPTSAALTSPAAVDDEEPAVSVEILDVSPAYVAPGQTLTVRGTVRNGTGSAIDEAVVGLRLQTRTPRSRLALDTWLDSSVAYRTVVLAETTTPLAPGASREVTLAVPVDDLGLTSWGPRGLELRVTGTPDGAIERDRTLVVWAPETAGLPTALTLAVPLAPTAQEWTAAASTGTSVAAAAADRVGTLVAATATTPTVAWGLDPALLAEAEAGAPTSATGLVEAIRAGAQGRDVVALPFADADAAAIAHADQDGLLTAAVDRGDSLRAAAGVEAMPDVAWPSGPAVDLDTVGVLQDEGASAVVVPAEQLATVQDLTYTPTGRATLPTDDGDVAALLADPALSAALGGGRPGDPATNPAARALEARQYLLGVTAMITAERPNDSRAVLAAAPREPEDDAAALAERVRTVLDAPWVDPTSLTALAARPAPDVERNALPAQLVTDGEATPGLLITVQGERARLLGFARLVPDPESLVRAQDDALLQVTSTAWRPDPDTRATYAGAATRGVVDLLAAVGVTDSGTVNLINSSGDLPVTVRNELDQPITAELRLVVSDPALQAPETVPVEVAADSEQPVSVPVQAVGSADVTIRAELVGPDGERVGLPAVFEVRVRADWENVGTAVVAGVIGVTFVLGLVRSIRRGRRRLDPPAGAAA